MAAKIDLKKSSRIVLDRNGYRVERVARVSGVTGAIEDLLHQAITDAQLPAKGDPHPTVAGITLNSLTAEPLGGGNYKVILSYYKDTGAASGSSNATVQANATTATEEIGTDAAGAVMTTTYQRATGPGQFEVYEPRFTADIEKPRVTFDFEYTAAAFPKTEIDTYLGKINSAIWNGYAVRTILCTAINVSQSGDEYRVRFSFAYAEDTWDFVAKIKPFYTSGMTTTDPALDLTTGTKTFIVYPQVDFTPLGFTL